jgi:hypothetical protein
MITKTEVFNSYKVTIVFDYTIISTTVFAMHEDACEAIANDLIKSDNGMPEDIFEGSQDMMVELLDRDVL